MSIDEEFKRVLNNPDHVIVSEELSDLLQGDEQKHDERDSYLLIDGESLVCQVAKLVMSGEDVTFSLQVPAFSIRTLLVSDQSLQIHFEDLQYEHVPSSDISWEDNLLTLKTRRIFNEAV